MHKAVQQQWRVVIQLEPVRIAMRLQPGCRGIEDASGGQMEGAYVLLIVSRVGEVGFQIVGVAAERASGKAGTVIVELAEIRIKGAVFLHHEDDVVYALQTGRRSSGGRRGSGAATEANSLTTRKKANEKHTDKQRTTREGNLFHSPFCHRFEIYLGLPERPESSSNSQLLSDVAGESNVGCWIYLELTSSAAVLTS